MADNVLKKYFRQVKASANLPSRGWWYDEDLIDAKPEAIPVLGYTAADELMLLTPDKLITGESTYDIIRSCVPSIKDPKKLVKIDIDALMVAIKIATSGNIYSFSCKCPLCIERYNNILNVKSKDLFKKDYMLLNDVENKEVRDAVASQINDLKLQHEMCIDEQTINVDAREFLAKTDYIEENEKEIILKNGLNIKLKPYLFSDFIEFQTIQFRYEKLQYLLQQRENMKLSDEELTEINKQTVAVLKNLINSHNVLLIGSIKEISTPEGETVVDYNSIKEFVENIDIDTTKELEAAVSKLNNKGVPSSIDVKCPYCNGTFKLNGVSFTESSFFG